MVRRPTRHSGLTMSSSPQGDHQCLRLRRARQRRRPQRRGIFASSELRHASRGLKSLVTDPNSNIDMRAAMASPNGLGVMRTDSYRSTPLKIAALSVLILQLVVATYPTF